MFEADTSIHGNKGVGLVLEVAQLEDFIVKLFYPT